MSVFKTAHSGCVRVVPAPYARWLIFEGLAGLVPANTGAAEGGLRGAGVGERGWRERVREYLERAPWILLAATVVVVVTTFNMTTPGDRVRDWLRDRLDPTS